jgi:hypothetical protein
MSSNPSPGQSQQQSGSGSNTSPGQQRVDHAPDMRPSAAEPGSDGAAPGTGDSTRTPWQGHQPVSQPPRQQQGGAVRGEQQQRSALSDDTHDTDDAGDTRPRDDAR